MDKRAASAALIAYCKLMEVIKARTALIVLLSTKPPAGLPRFYVAELQQLQVRMICETLAKACLVLHGDIAGAKSARLTTAYQADLIMNALEKLHPRFFPRPVRPGPDENGKSGFAGFVDIKEGFLTKKELLKSYHTVSNLLHAGEIEEILAGRFKRINPEWINDWTQKLITLLGHHTIYLKDGPGAWKGDKPLIISSGEPAPKQQVIVLMNPYPHGRVEAKLFELFEVPRFAPKGSEPQS